MVVRRARKHGLHDHGGHSRLDVLVGGLTSVGGGRSQSLLEIDGSDQSEPSRVVLVSPHARQALLVGIRHRLEDLLLCAGDGIPRGTDEDGDGDGNSEVSEGQNGK